MLINIDDLTDKIFILLIKYKFRVKKINFKILT